MVVYMNRAGIKKLVDDLVDNPQYTVNLMNPAFVKTHILGVADKSVQFAEEVLGHYPFLTGIINPERILVGGAGHDFGRPLKKNQNLHGLRSAKFIEERGLELRLTDDISENSVIAQMARTHGFTFEEVLYAQEKSPEELDEFGSLRGAVLIPYTLQELIVTAADFHDNNGEWTNPQKRIISIKERYSPGTDYAKTGQAIVYAVEHGAIERVAKICQFVDDLRQGKLTRKEIFGKIE